MVKNIFFSALIRVGPSRFGIPGEEIQRIANGPQTGGQSSLRAVQVAA